MNAELIARGHEFASKANDTNSPSMAAIYLNKAANYYEDGGRKDLARLCRKMRQDIK